MRDFQLVFFEGVLVDRGELLECEHEFYPGDRVPRGCGDFLHDHAGFPGLLNAEADPHRILFASSHVHEEVYHAGVLVVQVEHFCLDLGGAGSRELFEAALPVNKLILIDTDRSDQDLAELPVFSQAGAEVDPLLLAVPGPGPLVRNHDLLYRDFQRIFTCKGLGGGHISVFIIQSRGFGAY